MRHRTRLLDMMMIIIVIAFVAFNLMAPFSDSPPPTPGCPNPAANQNIPHIAPVTTSKLILLIGFAPFFVDFESDDDDKKRKKKSGPKVGFKQFWARSNSLHPLPVRRRA